MRGKWRGHAEPIESESTELLASLLATGVDVANDLLETIHSGAPPSASEVAASRPDGVVRDVPICARSDGAGPRLLSGHSAWA